VSANIHGESRLHIENTNKTEYHPLQPLYWESGIRPVVVEFSSGLGVLWRERH